MGPLPRFVFRQKKKIINAKPRRALIRASLTNRSSRSPLHSNSALRVGACVTRTPLNSAVEAVEKVPKQILGRDAEKSDLIECATINDLMPREGQVTPENHPLIVVRGFF
jgi:hypothetical protein